MSYSVNPKQLVIISALVSIGFFLFTVINPSTIYINYGYESVPTLIPVWIFQDIIILLFSFIVFFFILKNEKHPKVIFVEGLAFVFLYASVYENLATFFGYYRYGRSLIMILNVPLTIPIIEFIVIYSAIRLTNYMKIPAWVKPFIAGLSGILFDFSLDPLAVSQVFDTNEGVISRWIWYIKPSDANIFNVPIFNYSGWFVLCGLATTFLLVGRYYFKAEKEDLRIGFVYPVIAMVLSLFVLFSPFSQFILWAGPFFSKGSNAEWVMLGVNISVTLLLIAFFCKGMKYELSLRKEYVLGFTFVGFHLIDILFALIGGYYEIIGLQAVILIAQTLMLVIPWYFSKGKEFKVVDSIEDCFAI